MDRRDSSQDTSEVEIRSLSEILLCPNFRLVWIVAVVFVISDVMQLAAFAYLPLVLTQIGIAALSPLVTLGMALCVGTESNRSLGGSWRMTGLLVVMGVGLALFLLGGDEKGSNPKNRASSITV